MNALESRADPGKGGREPDWEAVHPYSADGGYRNRWTPLVLLRGAQRLKLT
jgi:hypothetical protein